MGARAARFTPITSTSTARRLPWGARPYLEAHALIHLRAPSKCIERLDVHEDVRPALSRLDEAESAFIIPGLDGSVEAHRLSCLTD